MAPSTDITGEVFLGVVAAGAAINAVSVLIGKPIGPAIDRAIERFALADPLSIDEAHELTTVPAPRAPRPRRPRQWGVRT